MKTLSPTQQACLDAMGIDVWVRRDSDVLVEEPPAIGSSLNLESVTETEFVTEPIALEKNTAIAPSVLTIPKDWNNLQQAVSTCTACALNTSRAQTVFGAGNKKADWLIVGDKPSTEDDQCGQLFTGQQGELLTAMLGAISLTRQQVYLASIVKCMPADKRDAEPAETEICLQYLKQQITLLQPKLILVVGQQAAQRLLNSHSTLARLRQKVHMLEGFNIPVIVTYHPASLLSMPVNKREAWHDLLFAQKTISTASVL